MNTQSCHDLLHHLFGGVVNHGQTTAFQHSRRQAPAPQPEHRKCHPNRTCQRRLFARSARSATRAVRGLLRRPLVRRAPADWRTSALLLLLGRCLSVALESFPASPWASGGQPLSCRRGRGREGRFWAANGAETHDWTTGLSGLFDQFVIFFSESHTPGLLFVKDASV